MNKIIEQQFTSIYNNNKNADKETVSGIGSKLENANDIAETLPHILKDYDISNIFDIGCGDFNWMSSVDLSGTKYTGGDIVLDVIELNKKYENQDINFLHFDITSDDINGFDLIILRGVLSFYNEKAIKSIINRIVSSGSKYILLTNNFDLESSKVNFLNNTYRFPDPLKIIRDGTIKHLCLWDISSLPTYDDV